MGRGKTRLSVVLIYAAFILFSSPSFPPYWLCLMVVEAVRWNWLVAVKDSDTKQKKSKTNPGTTSNYAAISTAGPAAVARRNVLAAAAHHVPSCRVGG